MNLRYKYSLRKKRSMSVRTSKMREIQHVNCGLCMEDTAPITETRKKTTYECRPTHCPEEFESVILRNNHIKVEDPVNTEHPKEFVCEKCNKVLKTKFGLVRHLVVHQDISARKKYSCYFDNCSKWYSHQRNVNDHVRRCHNVEQPLNCTYPDCKRKLSSTAMFDYHMACHKAVGLLPLPDVYSVETSDLEEETEFICDICKKAFKFKKKLRRHINTHIPKPERPRLLCPYINCNKDFTSKDSIKAHIRQKHQSNRNESEKEPCTKVREKGTLGPDEKKLVEGMCNMIPLKRKRSREETPQMRKRRRHKQCDFMDCIDSTKKRDCGTRRQRKQEEKETSLKNDHKTYQKRKQYKQEETPQNNVPVNNAIKKKRGRPRKQRQEENILLRNESDVNISAECSKLQEESIHHSSPRKNEKRLEGESPQKELIRPNKTQSDHVVYQKRKRRNKKDISLQKEISSNTEKTKIGSRSPQKRKMEQEKLLKWGTDGYENSCDDSELLTSQTNNVNHGINIAVDKKNRDSVLTCVENRRPLRVPKASSDLKLWIHNMTFVMEILYPDLRNEVSEIV